MEKYFNDAIIGNQKVTATLTKKGEIIRLLHPSIDYKQIFEFFRIGLKINDSSVIYLHKDINNIYNQYYTQGTNILNTEIYNTYFNLKILQTDYVCINENVLVRKYTFLNEGVIDLDLRFLIHSKLISTDNNQVSGYCLSDALVQYVHDYSLATFSKMPIKKSQINNTNSIFEDGEIGDKDYIGMSSDSSIEYGLGVIKANEEKTFEIYLYLDDNKTGMEGLEKSIERIKKIDFRNELEETKKYWRKFLRAHDGLELKLCENPKNKKIQEIYERTILLYPLLTNPETGGISASAEIDEKLTRCGKYAYCWPRDAVFITKAMDILKMYKETDRFYKIFCKMTQSRNGMWEQRFFSDGRLAPCWGYQIDETASVIYGIYEHYLVQKDKKFLKENLKMCEKALKFLQKYIDDTLSERHEMQISYDLWEMYEGVHLYSLAAIFAAYDSMIKIYDELKEEFTKNRVKQENVNNEKEILKQEQIRIKEYILQHFYDDSKKSFIRNLSDKMIDISTLGIVEPFKIFRPTEKKILNTVEKMNLTIRTYTGGYQRFEKDHYMNGNPWEIATLWMANYYLEANEYKKAQECFDFVVRTGGMHGFLPEQVNNDTMSPAWVIGLGWSHAMFIIVLEKMCKLGLIK